MSKFNIEEISNPAFLKNLSIEEKQQLADDIREFLIQSISNTGGHFSSNLGVVELTIALHSVFNSPTDKIIFDVGHQSYVHKILTGRAKQFNTLRQYKGLSGFQKRNESIHDVWEAGHSSTALSGAVGLAMARDLDGMSYDVISVIGDAAIVGGESLEALNHLGATNTKVIIVLNDNQMSISKNVGGFSEFLSDIRTSHAYNLTKDKYRQLMTKTNVGQHIYTFTSKIKNSIKSRVVDSKIFGEFGVEYLGPIDGHDIEELILAFEKAKNMEKSVVVHVLTKKGKGYKFAENDTTGKWHGVEPFNIETGEAIKKKTGQTWSEFIAEEIHRQMEVDSSIVTITPAMIGGSKLDKIFKDFPNRSFDVGIAEAHATTFAAGLALAGKKPFLSVYSSFLQRAYDQINHDLARMNLPVLIGIDRAGLVGADGETHHGVFDLGMIKPIPNTVIFQPASKEEAAWFIQDAFKQPLDVQFIRYSREICRSIPVDEKQLKFGKWIKAHEVSQPQVVVITYGDNVHEICVQAIEKDLPVKVVNACFLKPIDTSLLDELAELNLPIFVYETEMKNSGLGKDIMHYYYTKKKLLTIYHYGIEDCYVSSGRVDELLDEHHISVHQFIEDVKRVIDEKGKN